jgi:agmatine deiminase
MLIPDWQTDCVALVRPSPCWGYDIDALHEEFAAAIAAHDRLRLLDDPQLDIWIRDFAPFQTARGKWIGGTYRPSYLKQSTSDRISKAFARHIPADRFPIRLDGGTFVHNGRGVGIVTSKLHRSNRNCSPEELLRMMREHLELAHLVVVPSVPGDKTGHIDGILKWADERTLLVGRLEYELVIASLKAGLPRGVEIVPFPQALCQGVTRGWQTARGIYVNFLLTRNAVYLPVFGLREDDEALAIAERLFTPKPVVPIAANTIARHGGVLNCISWNFKSGLPISAAGSALPARI